MLFAVAALLALRFTLSRQEGSIDRVAAVADEMTGVRTEEGGRERREPGEDNFHTHPVALRIMVLTYNRVASLKRLLDSLCSAEYDGFRVDLDIWIDKSSKVDSVHDADVLLVSAAVDWPFGIKTVHPQPTHAGLIAQWIDTWQPTASTKEMCVFLEDDLEVSPYFFKWLKAAHEAYAHRPDVSGFTLQRVQLRAKRGRNVCLLWCTLPVFQGPVWAPARQAERSSGRG